MSDIIYLNRDNQIVLELRTNNVLQDLSGLTRAQLIIGDTTLDSATVSGYFDWTDTGYGIGTLVIDAGSATLTEGYYCSYLIIFDNTNPNGIVWGKKFTIVVEDI